ncbi:MAG TPA: hypothetical protein VK067_04605 [Pseudogracilibacillus sp.]|nr:hypothetical protein [Pseudogracilibacillus sp.]
MKKDIENLTIGELTEMGFKVSAIFHGCKNLQDSYNKMKPFTRLNSIERSQYNNARWTSVEGDVNGKEVSFAAFY